MAKFHNKIGFVTVVNNGNGLCEEKPIEKPYFGEVLRDTKRWNSSDQLIDDFSINAEISIVADSFAMDMMYAMRYVWYMGARWTIKEIDPSSRPRIKLKLGGLYNGPIPG